MQELERRGFGKFDPVNFGLWLNVDPILRSSLGADFVSLAISSFHFPLSDQHKVFIDNAPEEQRSFALNCFTMFAHERRHFHDMLATTYGSMLMRQYTRAALAIHSNRDLLYFGSDLIAVPLSDGIDNESILGAAGVPAAPDALRKLNDLLKTMQQKLRVFDRGWEPLPRPFANLTATSIMESLAVLMQEQEIAQHLGSEYVRVFRAGFPASAREHYYGAAALCHNALGEAPFEAVVYCLYASLCGNFQESRPDVPRYPRDLLAALLHWLNRRGGGEFQFGFEGFREQVDEFFEEVCGKDVQGIVTAAVHTNREAAQSYRAAAQAAAEQGVTDVDLYPSIFDNFCEVQAPFAASLAVNPSWYCGPAYVKHTTALPTPVVFLETVDGLPIGDLEKLYYIQTESRVCLDQFPPNVREHYSHLADAEGVLRAAHILSPKDVLASSTDPSPTLFNVPPIDVALWQRGVDEAGCLLRFLLEGMEGLIEPLARTALLAFGLTGVRVFSMSGELKIPPLPEDPEDRGLDPVVRKFLADPKFREALAELRASRQAPG